jgi:hypothetical protein
MAHYAVTVRSTSLAGKVHSGSGPRFHLEADSLVEAKDKIFQALKNIPQYTYIRQFDFDIEILADMATFPNGPKD